jgi:hypothetical protein
MCSVLDGKDCCDNFRHSLFARFWTVRTAVNWFRTSRFVQFWTVRTDVEKSHTSFRTAFECSCLKLGLSF